MYSIHRPILTHELSLGHSTTTYLRGAILAIAGVFSFLRFYHLDADFPIGLTWDGVLYTDEGWYANAAIRDYLFREWYLPGDFNPAVNMPLGQIIQRLFFAMFGLSLSAARLSEACAFSAIILITGLIVRKESNLTAGLLAALFLATDYLGFAYSRLAIMEPMGTAFVVISLYAALHADSDGAGRRIFAVILSVTFATAAILVKTSMIFGIPLSAYLIWRKTGSLKHRFLLSSLAFGLPLLFLLIYQFAAKQYFFVDFDYFNYINLRDRIVTSIPGWLLSIFNKMLKLLAREKISLPFAFLLVGAAVWRAPQFRSNLLVKILFVFFIIYFGILTILKIEPSRYLLPLLIPISGLSAMACTELSALIIGKQHYRKYWPAPAALFALIVLLNSANVLIYILNPQYSFLNMATDVGQIIRGREANPADITILGHYADSVSLVAGTHTMNPYYATEPLSKRLLKSHPGYLLTYKKYKSAFTLGTLDEDELMDYLHSAGGRATRLGEWEVYNNYVCNWKKPGNDCADGPNLRFYKIDWKS